MEKNISLDESDFMGIFDYSQDFAMNVLNNFKEHIPSQEPLKSRIKIGLACQQLSLTIKYLIHSTNCIDQICFKQATLDYDEILIHNLIQISHTTTKNRLGSQALKAVTKGGFFIKLLLEIFKAKDLEEAYEKSAEISLISDIIYQCKEGVA